jgi:hypothetical protein
VAATMLALRAALPPIDGIKTAQGVGTGIPPSAIPADANIKGMFSPVYDWPADSAARG